MSGPISLPPGNTALNLSDTTPCDLAAKWYAARLNIVDWPVNLTASYVRSLLPSSAAENATEIGDSQLFDWWSRTLDPAERARSVAHANVTCAAHVCQENLGFDGDADIAGIGMMISYFLAAILGSVYLAAFVADKLLQADDDDDDDDDRETQGDGGGVGSMLSQQQQHDRPVRRKGRRRWFGLSAFVESTNAFVEASLVLAVAMVAAAIVRSVGALSSPRPWNNYTGVGSMLMQAFSVLHAITLQAISDSLRRHRLRLFTWGFLVVLEVVAVVLFTRFDALQAEWHARLNLPENMAIEFWSRRCDREGELLDLSVYSMVAIGFMGANALVWLYYFLTSVAPTTGVLGRTLRRMGHKVIRFPRVGPLRTWRQWKFVLQVTDATLCLVVQWFLLVKFNRYRNSVLETAGEANFDNNWTFGQVLALTTWATVLFDFANVYINGPEAGLASKVSKRYKVVALKRSELKALDDGTFYTPHNEAKQDYGQQSPSMEPSPTLSQPLAPPREFAPSQPFVPPRPQTFQQPFEPQPEEEAGIHFSEPYYPPQQSHQTRGHQGQVGGGGHRF